jgi:Immunity protein 53
MIELAWLESWYKSHCDGVWEHTHGIYLETIDNPGWRLRIDGGTTDHRMLEPNSHKTESSEDSWISCNMSEGVFEGFCGPQNLGEMLQLFRRWIEKE